MKFKIAAIVVTYNRKELLEKCLCAINLQEYKPQVIYVIDNASTDGTENVVRNISLDMPIKYVRLENNMGGAGGFCEGIKTAHMENKYDAYWVMDDDGIPDKKCLANMLPYMTKYGYIAPLVLSVENPKELAFQYLPQKEYSQIVDSYGHDGIINNYSNPFNGVLFSRDLIAKIGYPKKELFIWGDEREYNARAKLYGYNPVTIIKAIHYHPKDRLIQFKDFLSKETIVYVDSKLRRYCFYRNSAYINKKYKSIFSHIYFFISYTIYFLFSRFFDFKGLAFFYKASLDGLMENFDRHHLYLNK